MAGGTRGTKNVAGNSSVSKVFRAILPLGSEQLGCAGEERASRSLVSPGYECRCRGGSTALCSGMLQLRCCCVSLVLSLSNRSGIGFVSSPQVFGACSDCRGVLLCHCYRGGCRCAGHPFVCPRCSFPKQFPSTSSSLPFKFCFRCLKLGPARLRALLRRHYSPLGRS